MKTRIISIALGISMLATCFGVTACKRGGDDDNRDVELEGMTNIRVATYNGGVGKEWLNDAAKRFEEKYAETSFEEGSVGVHVLLEESKTGDMLLNDSNLDKNVYLTEAVDYYDLQSTGKLADISDAVTADLGTYGDSGTTIAGKLDKSMKDFLTAKDGKYYAIPFYDGFYGIVYDADMFEVKGWYFDDAGNFTRTNKSKGIDGVAGTYDDGLPQTYAQFGKLIDKIRMDNVTPFVYSTESMVYFINLLANFWADYEGKENMDKNWSLTGDVDIISSFSGDTPVITQTTIGDGNMKDLQKQAGKYYALKFLKEVMMNNGQNFTSATDFKAAQFSLIQSCLDGEMQDNPVAMIIDGAWMENEADLAGTFDTAQRFDASYNGGVYKMQRKLAFMPIPMVDDSTATKNAGSKTDSGAHKQTIVSSNDAFCFVSASTTGAKLEVSKEFVKFLHSNGELAAFTAKTSITRPYTYTISDELKNGMSYFGKTIMEIKENSDIVYPYSNNAYYVANSSQFRLAQWGWKSKVNGVDAINPFSYFTTNTNVTAKAYFEGLYQAH